jgi:hypothetical protein
MVHLVILRGQPTRPQGTEGAVAFPDFGGTTVFHCHVARDNDRGMADVLKVL